MKIKERGIFFNGEMVRAILDGRKTQTRRVIKNQREGDCWSVKPTLDPRHSGHTHDWWLPKGTLPYSALPSCPFGKVGDRLWVREAWSDVNYEGSTALAYRADGELKSINEDDGDDSDPNFEKYQFANWYPNLIEGTEGKWRPSIHMPRWASRITLEITDIRVERLHGINEEDAKAEGVRQGVRKINHEADNELIYCNYLASKLDDASEWFDSPIDSFLSLWESIYGAESWQHGPWVWVVEFKVVDK